MSELVTRIPIPEAVLGVAVRAVLDIWVVNDIHGRRTYCKLQTSDKREVTMVQLDLEERWAPTIVTSSDWRSSA